MNKEKIILTGDRPTGKLHLGHYAGSLLNRVKFQDKYKTFIIIADLHTLTTKNSADEIKSLRENIKSQVLDYLSVGIDPEKSTIYLQSKIDAVYKLNLIFSMLITKERLERVPTLKDVMKNAHISNPSLGLLGYPVLQAADILMVNADMVPVGKDQESHLEIAREIARKFNSMYGEVFVEPEALVGEKGVLPGIDGDKMSKSARNAIYLTDTKEEVEKKVMQMYTDPAHLKVEDPGKIEGNAVFALLDMFDQDKEKVNDLKTRYQKGGLGDVEVKKHLIEVINDFLDPIRQKRREYENKEGLVEDILKQGNAKVSAEANKILEKAIKAMGLGYFS